MKGSYQGNNFEFFNGYGNGRGNYYYVRMYDM